MTFCSLFHLRPVIGGGPVAIIDNKRLGHVLEVARQSRENGTIIAHLNKEMS